MAGDARTLLRSTCPHCSGEIGLCPACTQNGWGRVERVEVSLRYAPADPSAGDGGFPATSFAPSDLVHRGPVPEAKSIPNARPGDLVGPVPLAEMETLLRRIAVPDKTVGEAMRIEDDLRALLAKLDEARAKAGGAVQPDPEISLRPHTSGEERINLTRATIAVSPALEDKARRLWPDANIVVDDKLAPEMWELRTVPR